MRVLSCKAPYGKGGLGQHFRQLVEASRRDGLLKGYYSKTPRSGDEHVGSRIAPNWISRALPYTPLRFSPGWLSYIHCALFDRAVAAQQREPAARFMGFAGMSLRSFRAARRVGFERLELVAATSHVNNVKRLHAHAYKQYPIERGWLNATQQKNILREYALADVIYVHSEYTRQSFLQEGIAAAKLQRMHLSIDARFHPRPRQPDDGLFRIVYAGGITTVKGIPVLLDAFARFAVAEAELVLVGGWSTRGMRCYMEARMHQDPRIRVVRGDPLPHLLQADVYVHPSYQDGFGYAPMEALRCGLPVIVTEDTGMKEHVREGENGYIVPTGEWPAILERLENVYANRLSQAPCRSAIVSS